MSFRSDKLLSLVGEDFNNKSTEDLKRLFRKYLENGSTVSATAHIWRASPGSIITVQQIRDRMQIIKPFTTWIRAFSVQMAVN